MQEVSTFRKNKIELAEYNYQKDIKNRVLMAQFSPQDLQVLEEILYSSIRFPIAKLFENLEISETDLFASLKNLAQTNLFTIDRDQICVDKEMRKYYEFQIQKFEPGFKPGMEYLHGLLRKVPIHILPNWYSIPRTSNNIFDSIIEKYFRIPQVYQRYLLDLQLNDPVQQGIMNAVYHCPYYEVNAEDMMKKFHLSREEFEECMLFLEFNFVALASFVREKNTFREIITPFYEWKKYLSTIREAQPETIIDEEKIQKRKSSDFAFIEEMSLILYLETMEIDKLKEKAPEICEEDRDLLISRLCDTGLAEISSGRLKTLKEGRDWLKMDLEERALYLHRAPNHGFNTQEFSEKLCEMRSIYEAEKCLSFVLESGWIFLDEFLEGICVSLNEDQTIQLKRNGRSWKYQFPEYSEEEIAFFEAIITQRFFQLGIVTIGTKDSRICFCVTPFGRDFFEK